MKIGIDIMGGDYAPEKTIHGAVLAAKELSKNTIITLFGKEDIISSELAKYNVDKAIFEIV